MKAAENKSLTPKKRVGAEVASPLRLNDYHENDVELLRSGYFADGTVKCQGRTWKVHRALLASRLKFFKAAFGGSFAEATSREVEFPEATPDSVDIMIRHLYSEELDVEALNTPLLCILCWKLADYLKLDTLKAVAASSLQDHLNAMLWLASSDQELTEIKIKPIWLIHFMDGFREVCAHTVLQPLQNEFVAFLWVARFEMLGLSEIWDTLDKHQDVRAQLHNLLIWHRFQVRPRLVPRSSRIETEIHWKEKAHFMEIGNGMCAYCNTFYEDIDAPWFYNPLPLDDGGEEDSSTDIASKIWCKTCVGDLNSFRRWGWRPKDPKRRKKVVELQAWSWVDDNQEPE